MDEARSIVALVALVIYPSLPLFWVVAHPLAAFLRRLPPMVSYSLPLTVCVAAGFALWWIRRPLLAVEFGSHPVLVVLAGLMLAAGIVVEIACRRQLSLPILVGVPELRVKNYPGELLTGGIYGRVRHPRYLGSILGLFGVACFANYLAIYLVALFFLPGIWLVTVLEERELVDRFGDDYRDYRESVPRFLIRLGRAGEQNSEL